MSCTDDKELSCVTVGRAGDTGDVPISLLPEVGGEDVDRCFVGVLLLWRLEDELNEARRGEVGGLAFFLLLGEGDRRADLVLVFFSPSFGFAALLFSSFSSSSPAVSSTDGASLTVEISLVPLLADENTPALDKVPPKVDADDAAGGSGADATAA